MKIMTDSPIRFPGLFGDWTITLSSKAINIGNGIYWYGILIARACWWPCGGACASARNTASARMT